jgi:hypothetical protein
MEQSGSKAAATDSVASKFSGVMTGMGLVSHALQEDDRTLSPVSVTGKIIDDQGGEALEVILQMKSVSLFETGYYRMIWTNANRIDYDTKYNGQPIRWLAATPDDVWVPSTPFILSCSHCFNASSSTTHSTTPSNRAY